MASDRIVVTRAAPGGDADHERATNAAVARMLAELQVCDFAGEYDPAARYGGRLYFVPSDTLLAGEARALRIRDEDDLFGGVVPFPFVATKAIVHPLGDRGARTPPGWSQAFAQRVKSATLPGFAAFAVEDARRAALRLLRLGSIRLKPGQGVGGRGQHVVADAAGLDAALLRIDQEALPRFGLSIELNLADATTYSIGQVRVAGMLASYCGTQRTITDSRGRAAFGGSDLLVVRGGFDALAVLALAAEARECIGQARAFDAAAGEYPGFFASRRNYDAVRGRDRDGRARSGVLEQSWRIGGASGPEIAALAALRADPQLHAARARSSEIYGSEDPPPGAILQFRGVDRRLGPMTKYTIVEPA